MKKFLSLLLATLLTFSPAYGKDYRYNEYRRHRDSGHRHTEAIVVGGILGLLVGSMIADSNRRRDEDYRRYDDRYCAYEQVVDRYGRPYWRKICP